MTHALRQNCGSFLYDNIRREWPVQESSGPTPASAGKKARSKKMEDSEEWAHVEADEVPEDAVSLAEQPQPPKEWPLFNMPAISSIRVTGFEVKSETGTVVSYFFIILWWVCNYFFRGGVQNNLFIEYVYAATHL